MYEWKVRGQATRLHAMRVLWWEALSCKQLSPCDRIELSRFLRVHVFVFVRSWVGILPQAWYTRARAAGSPISVSGECWRRILRSKFWLMEANALPHEPFGTVWCIAFRVEAWPRPVFTLALATCVIVRWKWGGSGGRIQLNSFSQVCVILCEGWHVSSHQPALLLAAVGIAPSKCGGLQYSALRHAV